MCDYQAGNHHLLVCWRALVQFGKEKLRAINIIHVAWKYLAKGMVVPLAEKEYVPLQG